MEECTESSRSSAFMRFIEANEETDTSCLSYVSIVVIEEMCLDGAKIRKSEQQSKYNLRFFEREHFEVVRVTKMIRDVRENFPPHIFTYAGHPFSVSRYSATPKIPVNRQKLEIISIFIYIYKYI